MVRLRWECNILQGFLQSLNLLLQFKLQIALRPVATTPPSVVAQRRWIHPRSPQSQREQLRVLHEERQPVNGVRGEAAGALLEAKARRRRFQQELPLTCNSCSRR